MSRHTLLALLLISITAIVRIRSEDLLLEVLEEVKPDIDQLIAPSDRPLFYDQYFQLNGLLDGLNFGELYKALADGTHDNKTCHICDQIIPLAKGLLQTPEIVTTFGKSICKSVSLYSERVCDGLLERMAAPVVYMLQNTKLDSAEICSQLLHPDCMTHLGRPMTDKILWELSIPAKKVEFKPKAGDGKPMKMIQVSDVHMDQFYTPGANSECTEPLCCRSTSFGNNHSAGPWGELDGDCDLPVHTALNSLEQMATRHPGVDFVVWTGDNTAHDVWNTTREINLKNTKTLSETFKTLFGGKVLPALGNHEAHPVNLMVPSEVPKSSNMSMSWLYDTLVDDYWTQWIPESKGKETFKKGGYHSRLVKPNLKAIMLNPNTCDRESYWIAYTSVDPDDQLKWLIEELVDSESNGYYTMIIGHVPPSNCYLSWFNNYLRIVERFEEVIVGHYFGHTHKDELFIYYNKNHTTNQTYPLVHLYIPGSITTYSGLNPSYKLFELDPNGRAIDFTTHYTDMSVDNAKGANAEPVWHELYSAKNAYGLKDLSTKSWDDFMTRAETDDKLIEEYYKNFHRNSETYVRAHSEDTLKKQRSDTLDNRVVNPIYSMLTPIKSN